MRHKISYGTFTSSISNLFFLSLQLSWIKVLPSGPVAHSTEKSELNSIAFPHFLHNVSTISLIARQDLWLHIPRHGPPECPGHLITGICLCHPLRYIGHCHAHSCGRCGLGLNLNVGGVGKGSLCIETPYPDLSAKRGDDKIAGRGSGW